MSNGGSDFVHLSATPSMTHDTSSSNQSELSGSSNTKHVRMGRGLVKVKRYENSASQGAKKSPTSPISPASADDNGVPEQSSKRRWFQPSRRRNISVGGIPADRSMSTYAKRGEVESWIDTQAREQWNSSPQGNLEVRPEVFDIRRETSERGSALTPTPSRPDLSIDLRYNAASPSSLRINSRTSLASSRRTSPLRGLLPQSPDEVDEDGRVLLEALGLGESTLPAEQAEPPQVNNISDYESEVEEEPVPQLPYVLPQIRPLPAIPPSLAQSQPIPQFNAPPPHDSQDAYAYVFGSSPRSSAQYRQSAYPPPPYASRYSTMVDQPTISAEDIAALQQHLREMEIREVAPLAIRRREDRLMERHSIVENS